MAIYWKGIDERYAGFRNDILATLSNTIMDQKFWSIDVDPARPLFLDLQEDGFGDVKLFWGSGQADPNVSAALFFCLKYLRTDELPTWIDSVVGIKHPLWQGSLIIWFVGMLDYLKQGRMFPDDVEAAKPELQWDNSHVLGSSENAFSKE